VVLLLLLLLLLPVRRQRQRRDRKRMRGLVSRTFLPFFFCLFLLSSWIWLAGLYRGLGVKMREKERERKKGGWVGGEEKD